MPSAVDRLLKASDLTETKDEVKLDLKSDLTNQQASALLSDGAFAGSATWVCGSSRRPGDCPSTFPSSFVVQARAPI